MCPRYLSKLPGFLSINPSQTGETRTPPPHWINVAGTHSKWEKHIQAAVAKLWSQTGADPLAIALRCTPLNGLHQILRLTGTGNPKETDNAMLEITLAMLRADAARWKKQNELFKRYYRMRGFNTDVATAQLYKGSHTLHLATAEGFWNQAVPDTGAMDATHPSKCSLCHTQWSALQLACTKCFSCT